MADNQNPTQGQGDRQRDQQQGGQNPRPHDPDQTRGRERPMDDPGRGQGDPLEEELPQGQRGDQGRQNPGNKPDQTR